MVHKLNRQYGEISKSNIGNQIANLLKTIYFIFFLTMFDVY